MSDVFGLWFSTLDGGMTRESFITFLQVNSEQLDENATQYDLIFDGALPHLKPEQPRENIHLLLLLPYSLFLDIL